MPEPELSFEKAAVNLIAELNNIDGQFPWHSVYMQTRIDDATHDTYQVLMVHIRPGHESKWKPREFHFGWPVEVHPWPVTD